MASAAPAKRMVSSVFITLASPYRATVTQQQHAFQTHNAPARDVQHAAVPVNLNDNSSSSMHALSLRRKTESSPSDSYGSAGSVGQARTAAPATRPTDPSPTVASHSGPLLGDSEQKDKQDRGSEGEVLPPPPSLPLSLETEFSGGPTEFSEGPAPPPPPPPQYVPISSLPVSPGQTPTSNKQHSTHEPETRTPSSGGDQDEQTSHKVENSVPEMTPESREVCGFCRKNVALSEPAIEALNRTYHESCFQCRQCHIPLAGKLYYNKAGIPLCEDCYQASLELCWACGEAIKDHVIRALERAYHPHCFTCATCSQPIGEQRFAQGEVGEVYCLQDYYGKYAPQCSACKQLIIPREDGTDSYTVECLGRSFHEDCYRCEMCIIQLSPEPNDHGCYPLDGRVLCKSCHVTMVTAQH